MRIGEPLILDAMKKRVGTPSVAAVQAHPAEVFCVGERDGLDVAAEWPHHLRYRPVVGEARAAPGAVAAAASTTTYPISNVNNLGGRVTEML